MMNDISTGLRGEPLLGGIAGGVSPSREKNETEYLSLFNNEPPPVMELDGDLIPSCLRDWITDSAFRMDNSPPDFIAAAAISALCCLVGRRRGIKPKKEDDWGVVPNTFGCAIGKPSLRKSSSVKEGFRYLTEIDELARKRYDEDMKSFAITDDVNKTIIAAAKDNAKKAARKGDAEGTAEIMAKAHSSLEPEPMRARYIVTDSTIEKLMEIERDNPMGIIVLRDELAGWLASLDREDRSQDRAFFLEGWNGTGSFSFDRIGRGSGHVNSHTLSVFGGIQPSKLIPYLRGMVDGGGDDGFMQRFQIMVYPDATESRRVDVQPDMSARDAARRAFLGVHEIPVHDGSEIPYLRFDDAGQDEFNRWYESLLKRISEEPSPFMQSHLTKFFSLMPSLALVFQLVEDHDADCVDSFSAARAVKWCEYFESHARRVYGMVEDRMAPVRILAERLHLLPELGFKVKHLTDKGWSGLAGTEQAKQALGYLVSIGAVDQHRQETGGRPAVTYSVPPTIRFLSEELDNKKLSQEQGTTP